MVLQITSVWKVNIFHWKKKNSQNHRFTTVNLLRTALITMVTVCQLSSKRLEEFSTLNCGQNFDGSKNENFIILWKGEECTGEDKLWKQGAMRKPFPKSLTLLQS